MKLTIDNPDSPISPAPSCFPLTSPLLPPRKSHSQTLVVSKTTILEHIRCQTQKNHHSHLRPIRKQARRGGHTTCRTLCRSTRSTCDAGSDNNRSFTNRSPRNRCRTLNFNRSHRCARSNRNSHSRSSKRAWRQRRSSYNSSVRNDIPERRGGDSAADATRGVRGWDKEVCGIGRRKGAVDIACYSAGGICAVDKVDAGAVARVVGPVVERSVAGVGEGEVCCEMILVSG